MARQTARGTSGEPEPRIIEAPEPRKLLKLYYQGLQMPSPQDGFLEPLGVRSGEGKGATLILECNISSLRYRLPIPPATRTERKKVKDQQAEGTDPSCPRHGPDARLIRAGRELVCTDCGIAYGRV